MQENNSLDTNVRANEGSNEQQAIVQVSDSVFFIQRLGLYRVYQTHSAQFFNKGVAGSKRHGRPTLSNTANFPRAIKGGDTK
jgi:hypothetical protein